MDHSVLGGTSESPGLLLRFFMPAEWQRIESVRQAVATCTGAIYMDPVLQDRIAMVSAELLENAVKHGQTTSIGFSLREDEGGLLLTVRNAVEPQSSKVETLRSQLSWIGSFADPEEAYLAAMARIYDHGQSASGGELGLVRVAYEGGCRLECDTSQPGWVTVQARYDMALPALT
jgi:hypothetical protein